MNSNLEFLVSLYPDEINGFLIGLDNLCLNCCIRSIEDCSECPIYKLYQDTENICNQKEGENT